MEVWNSTKKARRGGVRGKPILEAICNRTNTAGEKKKKKKNLREDVMFKHHSFLSYMLRKACLRCTKDPTTVERAPGRMAVEENSLQAEIRTVDRETRIP